MKKRYLAMMMGMLIAVAPVCSYAEEAESAAAAEAVEAGEDTEESGTEAVMSGEEADSGDVEASEEAAGGAAGEAGDASETLMGRVTEIGIDFLTITAGMSMGEGAPQEQTGNEEPASSDEGTSVTVTITEETQILKQTGGGFGGMNGGGQGEAPEQGDGAPDGGAADGAVTEGSAGAEEGSELTEDEAPDDAGTGEAEEVSEGFQKEEAPELPEGVEAGELPEGFEPGEMPEGVEAGEMPEGFEPGEMPEGFEPGEMPEGFEAGEMPEGMGGGMQPGETEEITVSELQEGDMVFITLNSDGTAATVTVQSMGQGGGMGQSSGVDSYDAVETMEEDTAVEGEIVASEGTDENAILVQDDVAVTLSDMTVSRESSDSTGGDPSSFYGVGAAILATDGTLYVGDSTVSTDADGGAGIFAYGDSSVYVADTEIVTLQDTSGGIHAAGGGTLYAWDVTAETYGTSSAAVRSDRGGGTMVIDGGTYTSNGADSPAVYCTADISIHDAELTANGSEAVCIEGLNTLRLYDCSLTGNMPEDDRNDNTWTVIVYQSMSGDSEIGNGTFLMDGGTLTSGNGGVFYTTNTECTITLRDVEIVHSDDSEFFLQCTGNTNSRGWGQAGSNGSDCLFTAVNQEMQGDVVWDSISTLDFYLTDGSTLTGAFVNDETFAGEGGDGTCSVYVSDNSTWVVTGDSTVTSLNCAGTIVDENENTVTVQGQDGTVYAEGDSEYTITVENYSNTVDLSGCASVDEWETYAVERPESI